MTALCSPCIVQPYSLLPVFLSIGTLVYFEFGNLNGWRPHINRLGTRPQNGAAAWRQLIVQQTICTPQKKRLVFTGTLSIVMKFCIPVFKKGDRRQPKNYRGISILNTCCKRYSTILCMKLQKYSEQFMTETQNILRRTFMHRCNILPYIVNWKIKGI